MFIPYQGLPAMFVAGLPASGTVYPPFLRRVYQPLSGGFTRFLYGGPDPQRFSEKWNG
jgi:hypothetical protein